MPDFSTLMLFAAASVVLTTPGPDMLLIASRSISQGRPAGFLTYLGIALGTYCHALAAALGLSQLFVAVPVAYEVVRWAGCAYLLYLAWKTLRSEARAFRLSPTSGGSRQIASWARALPPTCSIRRWRCSCWRCFRNSSAPKLDR